MNEIEQFYLLKEKVLLRYKEYYPFFDGNWKSFSTEDIRNLIDKIEETTGQTLSEKWIYTHLKPLENKKLPRKDTLNILSEFVGFSSWDEFKWSVNSEQPSDIRSPLQRRGVGGEDKKWIILGFLIVGICVFLLLNSKNGKQTIEIKNEFTNEKIEDGNLKVYEVKE